MKAVIPLFGRTGTGYLYASDNCTPDEAATKEIRRVGGLPADRQRENDRR